MSKSRMGDPGHGAKGSRRLVDGRLPADLMRSLRPSISHYVPALLLKDALAKIEYAAKKAAKRA